MMLTPSALSVPAVGLLLAASPVAGPLAAPAAAILGSQPPAGAEPAAPAPAPAAPSAPAPAAPPDAPARVVPRPDVAPDGPVARPEGFDPSAQNKPLENEITPEMERAVRRGLAALADIQNEDGTFGSGRFGRNVAVTSLAALAFMSDGHLPGRGRYGPVVEKALKNILENATETGLVAGDTANGPMYGHGFAALFLGEIYGMTGGSDDSPLSRRTHEALVRACRLIERTQNEEGGWRYNPVPFDADVSVTICQIMALRSARNAGIEIPKSVIDKAVDYVRRCQNPDGGFMYQLPSGMSAWPRSAAGVSSLYYAGIYKDDALTKGIDYLLRNAMPDSPGRSDSHYWYGKYYTAQSMYLAGGEPWARFWPATREELLRTQQPSGLWTDPSIGTAYGTSMALIVLQMPKRYLPIFQK